MPFYTKLAEILRTLSCSGTTMTIRRPSVELLCHWVKPMATFCPEVTFKEFKKCCISDEMDGEKDEAEDGNVGSEHESVNHKCKTVYWDCEDTEVETDDKNGGAE